jgi:hypothetical protein
MFLNSLHLRFGAMAAGVLLVGGYLLFGGTTGGEMIIQLDYSMYPEVFEGAEVEIDGNVVGELRRHGQITRSGFEVGKGSHTVRVLHPEFRCEPARIAMEMPGQKARFMLDLEERYDRQDGSSRTTISIRM